MNSKYKLNKQSKERNSSSEQLVTPQLYVFQILCDDYILEHLLFILANNTTGVSAVQNTDAFKRTKG